MKALWFSPGRLTTEYWEGKRARSIPPVSLYIFISAIYFIAYFSVGATKRHALARTGNNLSPIHSLRNTLDSLDTKKDAPDTLSGASSGVALTYSRDTSFGFGRVLEKKLQSIDQHELGEKFEHQFPKIFFFMIPVVAFFLRLLFIRRKNTLFVNHAIFSLHIHSFIFSIALVQLLNPFYNIDRNVKLICLIIGIGYFIIAMRRTYKIGYGRAILSTALLCFGYMIFAAVALVATALLLFLTI